MTVCTRCGSTYNVRTYSDTFGFECFNLCQPCGRELSRFLTGEPTPGLGGDMDPKRGFEIERGTDGRKEDSETPEAE